MDGGRVIYGSSDSNTMEAQCGFGESKALRVGTVADNLGRAVEWMWLENTWRRESPLPCPPPSGSAWPEGCSWFVNPLVGM